MRALPVFIHPETVGTSAVAILKFSKVRVAYAIRNNGMANIYIGGNPEVTTATGYPLAPGESLPGHKALGDDVTLELYAISTIAGQDVRVIETLEKK